MKNFILSVSKNKKWITLGLSILYLLLFCFPLGNYRKDDDNYVTAPFLFLAIANLKYIPNIITSMRFYEDVNIKYHYQFLITTDIIIFILLIACLIVAILCIVLFFKKKKFYFTPSLVLAFLTLIIKGLKYTYNNGNVSYSVNFYPTTYIFLILLILDIVYLILEWYYVHSGQEKLSTLIAERKAVKQARQDAELKQSPKYRIEQLEKELQELKAKNDEKNGH